MASQERLYIKSRGYVGAQSAIAKYIVECNDNEEKREKKIYKRRRRRRRRGRAIALADWQEHGLALYWLFRVVLCTYLFVSWLIYISPKPFVLCSLFIYTLDPFATTENRAGPSNLGTVFSQIILCKQLAPDFNAEELRSIWKDSEDIQRLIDDLSEFMPIEESHGKILDYRIWFIFNIFFCTGQCILLRFNNLKIWLVGKTCGQ